MFRRFNSRAHIEPTMLEGATLQYLFTESQKYGLAMSDVTPSPLAISELPQDKQASLVRLLPKEIVALEVPNVVLLSMVAVDAPNPSVTAHVDYNRTCALNAYMEVNGETTHYYQWERGTKQLTELASFEARQGEWWLLDTSKPHAVMLVPNKRRTILSFSFRKTRFLQLQEALIACGW